MLDEEVKKIREEFNAGIIQRVADIQEVLERAAKEGIITVNEPLELEALARIIIMAMYHGIALQIIHNPSLKGNHKIWDKA